MTVTPQPRFPLDLRYQAIADTLSDIGKTGPKIDSQNDAAEAETPSSTAAGGLVGPTLKSRSVVASRQNWDSFGRLLASQSWYRGFVASPRKVFDSDGSATIEKMRRRRFRDYTSILGILRALSYGLAAALAISDRLCTTPIRSMGSKDRGWPCG